MTTEYQRWTYAVFLRNLLDMRASFGNAGWVAVDDLGLSGPLYVRMAPEVKGGKLRIIELYLDGSQNDQTPITSRDLHTLPLGQIEALINAYGDVVNGRRQRVGPDLSTLASYYVTSFGNYARQIEEDRNWVVLNFANQLEPDPEDPMPQFRRIERSTQTEYRIRDTDVDFRLGGPPTDGLTDEFLGDVARAYAAAVARGERPNVAMAAQTGYPLKSVQRWVHTARQRRIMPQGRRGRTG